MGETLVYGCRCGAVRGVLRDARPAAGVRLVCMCVDCQAYARWLGRPDVLDAWRGTEVFQTTPDRVVIEAGVQELRCLRLSPRGLHRWYAACCRTPLGNTLAGAGVPFIGVPTIALGPPAQLEALGPVRARVQARYVPGAPPEAGHPRAPVGLMLRAAWFLLRAWVGRRHRPSPFRTPDGAWRVAPQVLDAAERAALAGPG